MQCTCSRKLVVSIHPTIHQGAVEAGANYHRSSGKKHGEASSFYISRDKRIHTYGQFGVSGCISLESKKLETTSLFETAVPSKTS